MREQRNSYGFIVQKAEGKRQLGKPRCRRKNNRINMKEMKP
jgi:hypothetical protein